MKKNNCATKFFVYSMMISTLLFGLSQKAEAYGGCNRNVEGNAFLGRTVNNSQLVVIAESFSGVHSQRLLIDKSGIVSQMSETTPFETLFKTTTGLVHFGQCHHWADMEINFAASHEASSVFFKFMTLVPEVDQVKRQTTVDKTSGLTYLVYCQTTFGYECNIEYGRTKE